jgi:transposase InsO family protein
LWKKTGSQIDARARDQCEDKTTDSQHDNPVAPNLLKRHFTADAPNTKWVADITGIGTAEGWFYLAAIVDIYSRMPRWVGHEQGAR